MARNKTGPISGIVLGADREDALPVMWGPWAITRRAAKFATAISATGLFGLSGWLFQNFLQVRGVVSIVASRVFLIATVLCLVAAVIIATSLMRTHKWALRIIVSLLLISGAAALDRLVPTSTGTQAFTAETKQSLLLITNVVAVAAQNGRTGHKGFAFNVFYENRGTATTTSMVHRAIVVAAPSISPEQEQAYKRQAASVGPPGPQTGYEIAPGATPRHYFSAPIEDDEIEKLFIPYQEVLASKKRMYLFVVMKYRDPYVPAGQVRVTEFCGWFMGTFEMWHNCGMLTYMQ